MFESALAGLAIILKPYYFGMLMIGMLAGTAVGIIPGMGGSVGLAVCVPFIIHADPTGGIALMVGLIAVTTTADTITSVLLAIPGTAGSVATIVDGHPMARKGEAARALSAAFTSSMLGGILGAVVLALSIPILGLLVKQFGSPEFLMLTMLGITAVAMLSGGQPLKGLLSAIIGLMLAAVGAAKIFPDYRYSFGISYLYDGIPLILVALGIFGIPEIIDLMVRGLPIAGKSGIGKGVLQGVKDAISNKWLILRCGIIGCYIGFVPGMGSSVANWLGYAHAVQSARGKGEFGKGDIRGVIAPESANNACKGGELIPTLLFGVPGSGSMAIMLMGLIMFGIIPGPDMVTRHLNIVFSIVWSLVIANVVGALLCMLIAKQLARIAMVKINILAPIVIIVIIMGAFQATQSWGDLIVLLALSVLGWVMKQTGFGRPPLIVGFVLGGLSESYLGLSIQRYGYNWIWHPWVIVIGMATMATLYFGIRWQRVQLKELKSLKLNADDKKNF